MAEKTKKKAKGFPAIRPKTVISFEKSIETIQMISDKTIREFSEMVVEFLSGLICSGRLAYSDKDGIKFKLDEKINDKEYLTIKRLTEKDLSENDIDPMTIQDSETPANEINKIVMASTGLSEEEFGTLSFGETGTIFKLVASFFL